MVAIKVMAVDQKDPSQQQQLILPLHQARDPCRDEAAVPPLPLGGDAAAVQYKGFMWGAPLTFQHPELGEGWINAHLRHPNVVTLYTALTVLRPKNATNLGGETGLTRCGETGPTRWEHIKRDLWKGQREWDYSTAEYSETFIHELCRACLIISTRY